MVVCSKSVKFLAKSTIFHGSSPNEALFAEKFTKSFKDGSLFENLAVFGQIDDFRAFPQNEALFATVCLKIHQSRKTWYFLEKMKVFVQFDDFPCFFRK